MALQGSRVWATPASPILAAASFPSGLQVTFSALPAQASLRLPPFPCLHCLQTQTTHTTLRGHAGLFSHAGLCLSGGAHGSLSSSLSRQPMLPSSLALSFFVFIIWRISSGQIQHWLVFKYVYCLFLYKGSFSWSETWSCLISVIPGSKTVPVGIKYSVNICWGNEWICWMNTLLCRCMEIFSSRFSQQGHGSSHWEWNKSWQPGSYQAFHPSPGWWGNNKLLCDLLKNTRPC